MATKVGLVLSLLLVSCTASSIRPVVKIGLLAPFEGVHRRTGYLALEAMRLAIEETASNVAIMPLALDEGYDATTAGRAAQKLLLDPAVAAVVGPLLPSALNAFEPRRADQSVNWFLPFAPNERAPSSSQPGQTWLLPFIQAVAQHAAQNGEMRLLLAGEGAVALSQLTATLPLPLPVVATTARTEVTATDAIFWVADVAAGARYLCQLRAEAITTPFWFGPQGDSPLLAELCPPTGPVAFVTWLDDGYAAWAQRHAQPSPLAYLTYRATTQAIAQINGNQLPGVPTWQITHFTIQPDGSSVLDCGCFAHQPPCPCANSGVQTK